MMKASRKGCFPAMNLFSNKLTNLEPIIESFIEGPAQPVSHSTAP
jgi:hypothetical protein